MSRAAVCGHPIAHSLSPVLHRAAYAALGLDDWSYEALDVESPALAGLLTGLDESWAGLSLTMPLKQTVLGLLDHVDPLAQVTGAANTVVFQGTGSARTSVGANTDVYGLVAALRESGGLAADGPTGPGTAVVLGGGATAASTLAALAELGFTTADVYVRSVGRTGDLQRAAHRMGLSPRVRPMDGAVRAMTAARVVVSTLPAHAADPWAAELGPTPGLLLDVSYDPLVTALSAAWRAGGGLVVPGQRMLLHQAAEQVRLMTGRVAPVAAMDAALDAALTGARPG